MMLQQHHADDDAADLADTADERDAADDAGRDGVQLIVQAGVCRIRADARALDEAGEAVHHARQRENQNGGGGDVHAGDVRSLGIGAYGEHVLAESRLVPDEPHHDGDYDGIPHKVGDGDHIALAVRHRKDAAGDEIGITLIQARR